MGLIYTSIFDVETIMENNSDYINTSTRELIYVKLYSVCCFNASGRLTFYSTSRIFTYSERLVTSSTRHIAQSPTCNTFSVHSIRLELLL